MDYMYCRKFQIELVIKAIFNNQNIAGVCCTDSLLVHVSTLVFCSD